MKENYANNKIVSK